MKRQMTTISSVILLSLTFAANLANAGGRTVDASDLDLRKPADAAILYERIKLAARMVCQTDSASWDAQVVKTFNRCKNAVIKDAVARFNQPLLTAMHEGAIDKVASN